MLGKLTKEQSDNILHSQTICRIACCMGRKPYLVPISFYYDGTFIYGQSEEGMKIDIMRKNPNVCLQTDIINGMSHYQSVLVFGTFEELKAEEAKSARKLMHDKIMTMMARTRIHTFGHETEPELSEEREKRMVMFRIRINEITGRFENQSVPLSVNSNSQNNHP